MRRITNLTKLQKLSTLLLAFCAFGNASELELNLPTVLQNHVGIAIRDASSNNAIIYQYNESTPLLIASNMKILTSWVAIQQLGLDFSWPTRLSYQGQRHGSQLKGNLYLRGGGAPTLTQAEVQQMLATLKQQGIRKINGDLILDSSIFSSNVHSSELFPEPYASYSVDPAGLLIDGDLSSVSLDITQQRIKLTPQRMADIQLINQLTPSNESSTCADVSDYISIESAQHNQLKLSGSVPLSCNQQSLPILALDPLSYNQLVLRQTLRQLGIQLSGKIKSGITPPDTQQLAQVNSASLASILPSMTLTSNNLYAKTLLLTLGAYRSPNRNTYQDGRQVYLSTIQPQLKQTALALENGAGLSRQEKITPADMVSLLTRIYNSPESDLVRLGFPTPGESGTLQTKFLPYAHQLYAKTGSLSDTQAYSGYFIARNGHTYVLSFIANDLNQLTAQPSALQQFQQFFSDSLAELNQLKP